MSKHKDKFIKQENQKPLSSQLNIPLQKENVKFNLGIFILFFVFSFLIYGNSLHSPFIWDDQYLITENHLINSFKNILLIFKHQLYYSTAGLSNFYRPLQTFFLMLDYALWKTNVVGYHITNIIFHLLCGYLIYIIINFLFKQRIVAFLVGLLFIVHPINSTVVNYISSRADSQATLFALLSFWLFFKASSARNPKIGRINYFCSIFSFVLALLSKELGIIIPGLILVSCLIMNKNNRELSSTHRISYKKIIPFFIILGIYLLLRMTVLNFSSPTQDQAPSFYIRLLTTTKSFVRLILLLFAPSKIHIEKSISLSTGFFEPSTFISFVILITIGIFAYLIGRYSLKFIFGITWFFVALIPMANIVPINTTLADHWLYLPCFGFFIALIGGIFDTFGGAQTPPFRAGKAGAALSINPEQTSGFRPRFVEWVDWSKRASVLKLTAKRILLFLYILIIGIFSALTIRQNTIWKDPLNFYQTALKFSSRSFRAHNEIGVIYLMQNKYDLAISEFKQATILNPRFDQAYDNLGVAYDKRGDLEEAILQHKKAIELNPYNAKSYNNLGNAYNNFNQFDKAIEAYQNALKLNPHYKAVYNNLGVAYYKKGMFIEARKYWEHALLIDPAFKLAADNLKALK